MTTNLKTNNSDNCQKIELYGSLTTKELKKKHSFRLVGGAETGSQGGKDVWQGGSWQTGRSHISMKINPEKQLGSKTDHAAQGSSMQKKASKPLAVKTCGGCGSRINSKSHRRVHWRDPQGPRTYTKPPTWESTLEGLNLLVGSWESD